MKSFSSFIEEARRSKIRPDAKRGDEPGVMDKSNNIATVNVTDEKIYEAQRGRPKKNATSEDPGSEHVVMQLRKVISTRGQHKVTHVGGEKSEVSPAQAHKMLAHHDNLKTSTEKHSYAARLHKSPESMKGAHKPEPKKAAVSLAGKITGTQNESAGLDVTSKTPIPHVNINTSSQPKAKNAPSSAGSSQRAATTRSAALQKNAEQEKETKQKAAQKEIDTRKMADKIRRSLSPKPPEAPKAKPMSPTIQKQ